MIPINDTVHVDTIFQAAQGRPQLIYIHSATCPVSMHAQQEVLQLQQQLDIPIYMVVVQNDPPVSQYIEKKSDIQHESPQLLLLNNGTVHSAWDHQDITADTVFTAVMQLPAS